MQKDPRDPIGGASRPSGWRPGGKSSVWRDAAFFAELAALRLAWDQVPEVRSDKLVRGVALVQDGQYPPTTTIRQIARFLAAHLGSDGA